MRGRVERDLMPLDDLRLQLTRKVTTTARTTANEWERTLKRTSPYDTGNMADKTTAKVSASAGNITIEAKVDTEYAHIVRAGQRPHVIRPRSPGGVLAFRSRGEQVFARSVNHPGARPRTWWDDSLRDLPDMLQRNWRAAR